MAIRSEISDPLKPSWFTPKRLLIIFCAINLINYIDRGAIASNGVNGSLQTCTESGVCSGGSGIQGEFNLSNFEDGVLSSAFMVGLLVASPIFASLAKSINPFRLIGVGLSVWTIAVVGCGCSVNFWFITICRMLVGVGEASFISLAAPFIDDNAPDAQKTAWLGAFYMCIPTGYAIGYIYGGLVGTYLAWRWAFWLEAILMLPFACMGFLMKPLNLKGCGPAGSNKACDTIEAHDQDNSEILITDGVEHSDEKFENRRLLAVSMAKDQPRKGNQLSRAFADIKVLLCDKVFIVNVLGYIAYNFVLGAYSYWGPKAGYYIYQMTSADMTFGVITVVCGIVGSLSGGLILDYMNASIHNAFKFLSVATFLGAIFCFSSFCFKSMIPFLVFFSIGELLIFSTQAPVNYINLQCVEPSLRPLSMAISTVDLTSSLKSWLKTQIGPAATMTLPSSVDRKYRRIPKAPLLPGKHHHRDVFEGAEGGLDGASFSGAVFNLSTTIVGAGIMALPATLKQLGMIPGLIAIIAAAFLTESSIDMILRFSRASKSSTYANLVGDAFGGFGRSILQACVVVNNIGMLVVYLIIIGDVLAGTWGDGIHHRGVMEEWFGKSWWTSRFLLLLLTTVFVFGPLISFKRVDSLRYTSALSVGLAIVFVAITAGIAIVKMMEGGVQVPPMLPELVDQASFWKLFTTIPVLVTAYICHHNVHPIENELIDTSQMKSIVRASLSLCTSVYLATSFFGYLLFGKDTLDDILANFDGDLGIPYSSLLNDVVRVSYCIHLMLVFPIVFFSLRINFDGLLFPYAVPIAYDNKRFFLMTVALMGFIFLGAMYVPSIWDAFQFTGATTAVSVGYIFPAAVALRDSHNISSRKDRLISWMMILLAVSSSTVAISSDIYNFIYASNE